MKINKFLIRKFGSPSVLSWETVVIEPPTASEIQVRLTAVGVNFIDIYLRKGLLPVSASFPLGIGVEGIGEVVAVGDKPSRFKVGDKVACIGGEPSCYAEIINFSSERAILLPEELDDEYVAAAMFKGLTAEYLINRCVSVQPNQTVLWHAAAGGVGQIAIQWLKSMGAVVVGTVSTKEKAQQALENGCNEVVITSEQNFEDVVKNVTAGKGVDVVYDSVGKDTFSRSLKCVKQRGTMVLFGNSSGSVDSFNPAVLGSQGSIYLTRPSIAHYTGDPRDLQTGANAVFAAIREQRFKIKDINRYALEDAASAHQALENRLTMGSTILYPSNYT
ncbi:MAG: hypothetical protein OFPII_42490 [Osedax symbiont Rs1]|nr:MAG: hypothetical protein OFPII_42490 [Osedax symbiont Rs1]